jgi:peptidoglycan/xylan/chitin deacetylase (PgdA/CDA1 family)
MNLALKVDVDSYRGTRHGVPALVELLKQYEAGATFLFNLGPDHTGRAIKRMFRPGFFRKVRPTSAVSHYGLVALMYGTLLPGPDIGSRCADILRAVRDAGFEVGIHGWDRVKWQNGVAGADAAWTRHQMELAIQRFQAIRHRAAGACAAAGR